MTKPDPLGAVVAARTIKLSMATSPQHTQNELTTSPQQPLEGLFPEALQFERQKSNAEATREELRQLDREIGELRGADFRELVNANKHRASSIGLALDQPHRQALDVAALGAEPTATRPAHQ